MHYCRLAINFNYSLICSTFFLFTLNYCTQQFCAWLIKKSWKLFARLEFAIDFFSSGISFPRGKQYRNCVSVDSGWQYSVCKYFSMNQLPILICIEFINSSINEWKSMCCNQQPPSHSKASWIRAHSNGIDWKYDCRFLFLAASAYFLIQKLTSQSLFMQLPTTFWDLSLYLYLRRWVKIHFVIILLCGSKVVLRCFMVSKWLGRRCKMHSSHTWALSNSSPHQICMTVFCWENSTTTTTKKMEWFGAHSPDIHSENGWKNEVPFRKICDFRVSVIRLVSVSFERIFGILSIKFIWCICILLDSEHP